MNKHKFKLMQSDNSKKIYLCNICDCQKTVFNYLKDSFYPKVTFYMRNGISIGNKSPECTDILK